MGYRTKLVKIGNSQGILIPKSILDQVGVEEGSDVELVVDEDRLVVQPVGGSRQGWDEAFAQMADVGDDALLDEALPNEFDEQEWEW